jgi:hypothetical protein
MPWSGWPTTQVSQLTFSEWNLTLRPGREVLVGYTLSYPGVWHVFGDDNWVWFNGVIRGSSGAIEIVKQWAEAENLGLSHRHWRWVHWRNPSSETVYASPRFVLAPPLDDRALRATGEDSRTKRIWTIGDVASANVDAFGFFSPGTGDGDQDGRGGERDRDRGMVPGIALRPLEGQRLQTIDLRGDDRFLPLEELDARIDRLRADYGGQKERD